MKRFLLVGVLGAWLAGCAAPAPESTSQAADDTACTAQGDTVYNQDTIDEQGRTAQNGLIFGGTPTHVFDAEQMGALHQRDSDIANCEANGNSATPAMGAAAPPHIVGSP